MARTRSPNYPSMSLAEAITRVTQVFAKEHRHPAPKEVVMKAMGYSGVNGASLGALSAVAKYGLLEKQGENYRVSERALQILHPRTPDEKAAAIREAAFQPALFADIAKDFPGRAPSDDNLRAYLIRRGFAPSALAGVIQAYRETMALVTPESGDYMGSNANASEEPMQLEQAELPGSSQLRRRVAAAEGDPLRSLMKVSFTGDAIEISGRVRDQASVDKLVEALQAMRPILPPSAPATDTTEGV